MFGAAAGCRCRVLLEGAAVRVACALSSLVCWCRCTGWGWPAVRVALEVACWCRWRMLLQGVAVLELVPLQGAVEGCCFRVLSEQRVRFGAGLCCCRVPLQGAAVRVRVRFGGLLVPLQGAAVLLEWRARCVELACRCYCLRAVCILGTWVLLQGTAVRVRCALWNLGTGVRGRLRHVYGSVGVGPWWRLHVCRNKTGERLVAMILFASWGLCHAGVLDRLIEWVIDWLIDWLIDLFFMSLFLYFFIIYSFIHAYSTYSCMRPWPRFGKAFSWSAPRSQRLAKGLSQPCTGWAPPWTEKVFLADCILNW